MTRFVLGVVVGIALATWGIDGVTNMVSQGVAKIQDGARTVQTEVTKQPSNRIRRGVVAQCVAMKQPLISTSQIGESND